MRPDMGEWDTIDRKVYGAPLPVWQVLATPNWGNLRGIEVEHAVATSLNLLTYEFPSIHIFHSSSLEVDRQNEVDSILVYKGLILLIEAKASPPNNRYQFGLDGQVRRYAPRPGSRTRQTRYAGNQLEKKIEMFQQQFPSMQVHGMYVFHGSDAVQMSQLGQMQIVPFAQLLSVVRAHLNAHQKQAVTAAQRQDTSLLRERLIASQSGGMVKTVKKMLKRNPDLMVFQDSLVLHPRPETFKDRLEATINIWRK